MPSVRFKAVSVYVKSKKAGEFRDVKYSYKSGDEAQIGDPGYIGHSDGAAMTHLSCTAIHPVGGMSIDSLLKAMQNKEDLEMALGPIDGSFHEITMRTVQADIASSHKDGSQTGDYSFEGGDPTIV